MADESKSQLPEAHLSFFKVNKRDESFRYLSITAVCNLH